MHPCRVVTVIGSCTVEGKFVIEVVFPGQDCLRTQVQDGKHTIGKVIVLLVPTSHGISLSL